MKIEIKRQPGVPAGVIGLVIDHGRFAESVATAKTKGDAVGRADPPFGAEIKKRIVSRFGFACLGELPAGQKRTLVIGHWNKIGAGQPDIAG